MVCGGTVNGSQAPEKLLPSEDTGFPASLWLRAPPCGSPPAAFLPQARPSLSPRPCPPRGARSRSPPGRRSRSRSRSRRRHQRRYRRYSRSYSRSHSRSRSRRYRERHSGSTRRSYRSRSRSRSRGRLYYRRAYAIARGRRYYGFGRTVYPEERRSWRERSRSRSRSPTPFRLSEKGESLERPSGKEEGPQRVNS